jgi:hypothetical protein
MSAERLMPHLMPWEAVARVVSNRVRRACASRRRWVATIAVAATALLAVAGVAQATIHTYCNSCFVDEGTTIHDGNTYSLVGSYFHYLGTGNRYIGAGAWGYGSVSYAYNEVYRAYGTGTGLQALADNTLSGHGVTADAHASY